MVIYDFKKLTVRTTQESTRSFGVDEFCRFMGFSGDHGHPKVFLQDWVDLLHEVAVFSL